MSEADCKVEDILLRMSSLVDSGSSRMDSTLDIISSVGMCLKSVGEFMHFIFIQGMGRNIPDPLFVGLAVFLV